MSLSEQKIRRLVLIKRLYQRGSEQAQAPEPLNVFALLDFHDAAEWLLGLLADYLEVSLSSNVGFMDYWNEIQQKSGAVVTHKNQMRRLNNARVELKHRGTRPARQQVLEYRASTQAFLEDNCRSILDVSLEEVSLASLVPWEEVREELDRVDGALQEGDYKQAMASVAIAMDRTLREAGTTRRQLGETMLGFGGLDRAAMRKLPEDVLEFARTVRNELEEVRAHIRLFSIGVEPADYRRFNILTPHVARTGDGTYHVTHIGGFVDKVDQDDVEFCRNFLIDTALSVVERQRSEPDGSPE